MKFNLLKINKRAEEKVKSFLLGSFFFVFIFTNIFSGFFLYPFTAEASFNKEINYQGKLTTTANIAVTNGSYNMEFKIYDQYGSLLWTETRTSGYRVVVSDGLFSIMLGEVNPLTGVDFNQTLYLGVNIGGMGDSPSWDGEMSPRKKLGTVPAAIESEHAAAATTSTNLAGGNSSTLLGSIPYQSATDTTSFVSPNTSLTKMFFSMTGDSYSGAAPTWQALTAGDVGLDQVTNESKATMFTSPTFTGTVAGFTMGGDIALGANTFTTSNTTLVTNLNADLLDGQQGSYYATATSLGSYVPYTGATGAVTLGANTLSTTSGIISPKIYPASDSTTAFQINKANGTTNVLNVDTTNGRIGIGTTAPAYALDVNTGLINASGYYVGSNGFSTLSGSNLIFRTGSSSALPTLTFNGKNDAPAVATGLDITGSWVSAVAGATKAREVFNIWDTVAREAIRLESDGSAAHVGIGGAINANNLLTVNGQSYFSGNVGIGETNPSQKLDVVGSIEIPTTTSSTTGVIYKGANRFIHNFALAGTDGQNTFVGINSGNFTMTGSTSYFGSYNTGIGTNTLTANTTGHDNTAIGTSVLTANTTGYTNTGIGSYALYSNTTGGNNFAFGDHALFSNIDGGSNIAIGNSTLRSNVSGYENTAIGTGSLYTTTGSGNIALGYFAGRYETGSNAFYVDNQDRTNTAGDKANALLYGTFAATPASQKLTINANVGIGTTAPNAKTEILSTTEQLRLSYDATHYSSFTVNSVGDLTLVGGTTAKLTATTFVGALTGHSSLDLALTGGTMSGAITGATGYNGLVVTANTGVITTGTWNGTTIAVANGGTGVTTGTTINGTAISYGTTNTITAAAGTLTGTSLNSTVTGSSLTSVGTLTGLTMGGSISLGANTLTTSNTGLVTNLNADLLDGQQGAYYATATSLGSYLPLAGGTMSGSIAMGGYNISGGGTFTANSFVGATGSLSSNLLFTTPGTGIVMRNATLNRWITYFNGAESTANAGSDYTLYRYDDAGTYLGTALTITRATGLATFGGAITSTGIITATGTGANSTNWTSAYNWGNWNAGSLTTGYLPYKTATNLEDSPIFTNGTNVGIGTTAPTAKLTVGDATAQTTIGIIGNSAADKAPALALVRTNGWYQSMPNTTDFSLGYNIASYSDASILAGSKVYVTSTGNVGIGTTVPTAIFHVNSTTINKKAFQLDYAGMSSNSGNVVAQLNFAQNTTAGGALSAIDFQITDTSTGGGTPANKTITGLSVDLTSSTYGIKNAAIFMGGNVGIGTTGPGTPLHISKSSAGQLTLLKLQNFNGATNDEASLDFTESVSGAPVQRISGLRLGATDYPLTFSTYGDVGSLTEKMRITNNGNVGIGTTNPTALLSVGSTSQFQVSSAGAVTSVGVNSGAGLIQGTGGLTITGTVSLPANSITDAMVSDTLTASVFKGSGSTTDAVDLATAEVAGILSSTKGGSGINNSVTLNYGTGGTLGSNAFSSTAYLPLTGGTLTGVLNGTSAIFSAGIGAAGASLSGSLLFTTPGTGIAMRNATLNRWVTYFDGAESTGNAGSNYSLYRYDDAGTYLGTALVINRATGLWNIGGAITSTGIITATGTGANSTNWTAAYNWGNWNAGSLTTGYLPYKTATNLDDSPIFTNGTSVGIGTTSPGSPLDVRGTIAFGDNGTGPAGYLSTNGGFPYIATNGAVPLLVYTNGNEQMRITSGGYVGIGTMNPGYKLEVQDGDVYSTSAYPGTGGTPATRRLFMGTFNSGLSRVAGTGLEAAFTRIFDTDFSSQLRFYTAADNVSVQQMVIDNGGNVGIGTTAPYEKLNVMRSGAGAIARFGDSVTGKGLMIYIDASGTSNVSVASSNTDLLISPTRNLLLQSTAGNVGIGTTAPLSKLVVNGGLHVGGDSDAGDNNILADGTITSTGTLTANGALDANGAVTLGDNGDNVTIDSNVWDVTGAGVASGLTGITSSGTINFSGLTASKGVFTDASKNLTSTGTLGVTQGGTGTSTAFTAGSIVFAGASGIYTQDNAAFFINTALNRLGVGTNTPTAKLDITQPTTGVGTVSNLALGTTVTGVGTQFTDTFKVGDTITIVGQTVAISAIASDTSMTTAAITNANTTVAYTLVGGSRFVVQGNGTVGIGTINPTYNLHVVGTTYLNGSATTTGLLTGTLGTTITGAIVNLNASSNFATNINTGTSTGAVTIGGGTATQTVAINSADWDISTTGVATNFDSYNGLVVTPNTGVITTGTWSATDIAVASGGTGVGTFTTNGVLYGNSTTSILATAQGAANTILTANAGAPSFSAAPTIGTSVSSPIFQGAAAAVTFGNASYATTIAGSALTISPTAWTATPTISGLITATSGLTSPSTATNAIALTGAGAGITFSGATTTNQIITAATADLALMPGTGFVGIGTTAPNGKLEIVNGNLNGDGAVFGSTSADNNFAIQSYMDSGVVGGGWAGRTTYVSGNNLALQPDAGTVSVGGTAASFPNKFNVTGNSYFSGTIGIGLNNPSTKVQIYDAAGWAPENASATPLGAFSIKNSASAAMVMGVQQSSPYEGWIQMRSGTVAGSTYPLSLNPLGGNVGIGTTAPAKALEILRTGEGAGKTQLRLSTTASLYWDIGRDQGNGNFELIDQSGNNRFTIDQSNGNVGIGTTAPNGKLDVSGTIPVLVITDTSALAANVGGTLSFYNKYNAAGLAVPYATIKGIRENANDSSNSGVLVFATGNNGTGPSEKMRINSTGNVGIGTTGPLSKLVVNGGLHVGGDSDALDNNILADGTITATGGFVGTVTGHSTLDLALTGGLMSGAITGATGYNGLVVTANTGVITTGTWSATDIAVANGGTGVGTFTTNGVLYGNSTTSILATAQGAANTILTANAGAPSFSASPTIGTSVSSPIFQGAAAAVTIGNASYNTTIVGTNLTMSPSAIILGGGTSASELRFKEPSGSGTAWVGFVASSGLDTTTTTYVLPTAFPATSGMQLSSSTTGTMSWTANSSTRNTKENIVPYLDSAGALATILNTPIYNFNYKPGMGTGDSETTYVGVIADQAPWAMQYGGTQIALVNTLGYMVLGTQATNKRIDNLSLTITDNLTEQINAGKILDEKINAQQQQIGDLQAGNNMKNNPDCYLDPASGVATCSSDMSLKKNVTTSDGKEFELVTVSDEAKNASTFEKMMQLTAVTYNWNGENDTDPKHIGFVTEQMEQLFPDLVTIDPTTGLKSIGYTNLIPYTVSVIQEMNLTMTSVADMTKPNTLRDSLTAWLGNASNKITRIFTGEICLTDDSGQTTCINRNELNSLKSLINTSGTASAASSGGTTTTTTTTTDTTTTDSTTGSTTDATDTTGTTGGGEAAATGTTGTTDTTTGTTTGTTDTSGTSSTTTSTTDTATTTTPDTITP